MDLWILWILGISHGQVTWYIGGWSFATTLNETANVIGDHYNPTEIDIFGTILSIAV